LWRRRSIEAKERDGVGEDGEWDSDAFYRVSASGPVGKTRALEEEEAKRKRNRGGEEEDWWSEIKLFFFFGCQRSNCWGEEYV
jgi:hypothetical protein